MNIRQIIQQVDDLRATRAVYKYLLEQLDYLGHRDDGSTPTIAGADQDLALALEKPQVQEAVATALTEKIEELQQEENALLGSEVSDD